MELLTNEALQELDRELELAMDEMSKNERAAKIDSAFLCINKDTILAFIDLLVGLLPGVLGKIAGTVIKKAAEAWFKRHCD